MDQLLRSFTCCAAAGIDAYAGGAIGLTARAFRLHAAYQSEMSL